MSDKCNSLEEASCEIKCVLKEWAYSTYYPMIEKFQIYAAQHNHQRIVEWSQELLDRLDKQLPSGPQMKEFFDHCEENENGYNLVYPLTPERIQQDKENLEWQVEQTIANMTARGMCQSHIDQVVSFMKGDHLN